MQGTPAILLCWTGCKMRIFSTTPFSPYKTARPGVSCRWRGGPGRNGISVFSIWREKIRK